MTTRLDNEWIIIAFPHEATTISAQSHRGVPTDPGRVATLIEAPGERCYGRAFLIEPEVFEHLDYREKGGYQRHAVDICFAEERVLGVVYIAETDNHAFLGEAPVAEIVAQTSSCAGPSGTNVDYLLELAGALRNLNVADPHVFEIETLVQTTNSSKLEEI